MRSPSALGFVVAAIAATLFASCSSTAPIEHDSTATTSANDDHATPLLIDDDHRSPYQRPAPPERAAAAVEAPPRAEAPANTVEGITGERAATEALTAAKALELTLEAPRPPLTAFVLGENGAIIDGFGVEPDAGPTIYIPSPLTIWPAGSLSPYGVGPDREHLYWPNGVYRWLDRWYHWRGLDLFGFVQPEGLTLQQLDLLDEPQAQDALDRLQALRAALEALMEQMREESERLRREREGDGDDGESGEHGEGAPDASEAARERLTQARDLLTDVESELRDLRERLNDVPTPDGDGDGDSDGDGDGEPPAGR